MEQPQPVKVMLGTTAVPQKKNPHKSQARGLPDADRAAIVNAIKKLVSGRKYRSITDASPVCPENQPSLPAACGSGSRYGSEVSVLLEID